MMRTKPQNIPPALTLHPEVNLLTEFAVIATSPMSPLVREVSGDNSDARRREDDSPPFQLGDPKQMVWGDISVPVPFRKSRAMCAILMIFQIFHVVAFKVN